MLVNKDSDLQGMKQISEIVAQTLKAMCAYAAPGMSTKELDNYGADLLKSFGARSAPIVMYKFPGTSCISVNQVICHGVPSEKIILQEGDLINIDVSAELGGYYGDNGFSFVLGKDIHGHQTIVNASINILNEAVSKISEGVKINEIGGLIENRAKEKGYKVIKNLTGHGIGRKLHEAPREIANFKDPWNNGRFKENMAVAVETFITSHSNYAVTTKDGWTMVGNKGGFMAQHEHTLVVTKNQPIILTQNNGIPLTV